MNNDKNLNIGIIDSNRNLRDLMKLYFQVRIGASIAFDESNGFEIEEKYNLHSVDVLVMDVKNETESSIVTCDRIHGLFPNLKIIVQSIQDDQDSRLKMYMAGCCAFVSAKEGIEKLLTTIEGVTSHGNYVCEDISKLVNYAYQRAQNLSKSISKGSLEFERYEIELMKYWVSGLPTKHIAKLMKMSERNVENIKKKLRDRTLSKKMEGVVHYMRRFGYLSGDDMEYYYQSE